MLLKLIRKFLGLFVQLIEFLTKPKGVERNLEAQALVDQQTSKLKLYQFAGCPFCAKVRRTINKKSLKIELRDASGNEGFRNELMAQGGQLQVPCLRIEQEDGSVRWLYESDEINQYLEQRFP